MANEIPLTARLNVQALKPRVDSKSGDYHFKSKEMIERLTDFQGQLSGIIDQLKSYVEGQAKGDGKKAFAVKVELYFPRQGIEVNASTQDNSGYLRFRCYCNGGGGG